MIDTRSPKRPKIEVAGAVDLYPYYAGFSFEWAKAVISTNAVIGDLILDPWNGSGTSTLASQSLGLSSIGVDRNPAVGVVAKARLATRADVDFELVIPPVCEHVNSNDPLRSWFAEDAVTTIRSWVNFASALPAKAGALLTLAIFQVVRELTRQFEGSNPTWVRRPKDQLEATSVRPTSIHEKILERFERNVALLPIASYPSTGHIVTATADLLPIKSGAVDVVIGSPPYLTRIDYAVSYSRELAVLGVDITKTGLRANLMGTTLIRKTTSVPEYLSSAPKYRYLISHISNHASKDSSGYYRKQAVQYFADMARSYLELVRISHSGTSLTLVLQDSFYKEVHVPLAELSVELLTLLGWKFKAVTEHPVPRLLTTMNTSARSYKKGPVYESVIELEMS